MEFYFLIIGTGNLILQVSKTLSDVAVLLVNKFQNELYLLKTCLEIFIQFLSVMFATSVVAIKFKVGLDRLFSYSLSNSS